MSASSIESSRQILTTLNGEKSMPVNVVIRYEYVLLQNIFFFKKVGRKASLCIWCERCRKRVEILKIEENE